MADSKVVFKKVFFYVVIFGLAIVVCFLILEFVFGRYYYSNVYSISDKSFDSVLGWKLKPGMYWIKPPNTITKHSIYINRYGLRNRDISDKPEEGVKRIIVLGDSYTYAKVSRTEDTFTMQLENELNRNNDCKRYEIINSGVAGYGNAQELLLMKYLSEENINGDIYLLMIFTNDILDNLCLSYGGLRKNLVQPELGFDGNGNLELKRLPQKVIGDDSGSFISVKEARKRTGLIYVLKVRIESFLQSKPNIIKFINKLGVNVKLAQMPGLLNGWYREEILKAGVPLMKGIIREIRDEAQRRDSKLLVSLIPSTLQVYPSTFRYLLKETFPDSSLVDYWLDDIDRPQRIVCQICDELNVPFLDLYPIFYENNEENFFISRDGHFNVKGHTIVAHSLERFIVENTE